MYRQLFFLLLVLCGTSSVQGGFIVTLSSNSNALIANTPGQEIQVFLKSDSGSASAISMDLAARIGTDAAGTQASTPVFSGFNFNGSVWDAYDPSNSTIQAPEAGNPHRAYVNVASAPSTVTIDGVTPTLVGAFIVDTTGINTGTWQFRINSFPGAPSVILAPNFEETAYSFTGTISITAVPEPTSLLLVGCCAASMIGWRRRREDQV